MVLSRRLYLNVFMAFRIFGVFAIGRGGEFHFAGAKIVVQSSFMLTIVQPFALASSQALSSLPICEERL